jgi:hypothetical protein
MSNVLNMPMRGEGIKPLVRKDWDREFIVVDGYSVSQQRVLSTTIDDVEIEVDLSTYDRMERDSTIAKAKRILLTNVLSDELQMAPGATDDRRSSKALS